MIFKQYLSVLSSSKFAAFPFLVYHGVHISLSHTLEWNASLQFAETRGLEKYTAVQKPSNLFLLPPLCRLMDLFPSWHLIAREWNGVSLLNDPPIVIFNSARKSCFTRRSPPSLRTQRRKTKNPAAPAQRKRRVKMKLRNQKMRRRQVMQVCS